MGLWGNPMTISSSKFRLIVLLLCFFFGVLGVHRFYVGKVGTGIAQLLLTLSFFGIFVSYIWVFVDFLMIAAGLFTDKRGRPIIIWTNQPHAYEENN